MTDLTTGSIEKHVASMAAFIGAGLVFQSAYFIVDLYFVSRLGPQAMAGVGAAGNFSFLSLAAAQLVGVSSLAEVDVFLATQDVADAMRAAVPELFDARLYLARNQDVLRAGVNPWLHYAAHGRAEGSFGRMPNDPPATKSGPI